MGHRKFSHCIDLCNQCAIDCDGCATDCLHEEDVEMLAKCIQYDRYCASVCRLAVEFMSGADETTEQFALQLCGLCADVCEACAKECERHSEMEHCRRCAETCKKCAEACGKMSKEKVFVY